MNDIDELEHLIRAQIDEPAVRELHEMYMNGLVTKLDIAKFKISAQRYKAATLAEHSNLDPTVRRELMKSLLSDYQVTIQKLIRDISARKQTRSPLGTSNERLRSQPELAQSPERAAVMYSNEDNVKDNASTIPVHGGSGRRMPQSTRRHLSNFWNRLRKMGTS